MREGEITLPKEEDIWNLISTSPHAVLLMSLTVRFLKANIDQK